MCDEAIVKVSRALNAHCLFLSRLSPGKIAELERPRRHPKAFGTPSNLLSGTPSSVPYPRSDECRAQGVPSMCDYSLDLVASRPAKVGDELITTKFKNSIHARICCNRRAERGSMPFTRHGGRVRKGSQVRAHFCSFPEHETREESSSIAADQHGQAERASRCAGVPRRGDRAAHALLRRPARDGAAIAGFSAPCERSGAAKARFTRQLIGLLTFELAWLRA